MGRSRTVIYCTHPACAARDERLGGLDDATALCTACGGLMLRLDDDIWAPYFREQERTAEALDTFKTGLRLARRPLETEIAP